MPSSLLFGISLEGRVYALSTKGSKWRELVYLGLEFKTLSAVPHMLWAVGGDRQVYVYVHGIDIPIRIKEEAFENERWLPVEGFSNRLFPMDRYQFSSADGLTDRSLNKVRLPSMAWQWESDWHLELSLDGQTLDQDGWTYAVDFPAKYYPQKQWKSCVRRRKWVRYRRYSALNSWCAIAPLHKDATQEPFIDVAVGGQGLTSIDEGSVLVWAVTAHGRVMFRTGVSCTSPEGQKWVAVSVPQGSEVKQICVGATGLVWAILWNGRALVRLGVSRHNPMGEYWCEVSAPNETERLSQVSVGTNAVWAVTTSNHVWFRRGVRGNSSSDSEEYARGCGWVEMVGSMALISVAANDQVWAIGAEDRLLYFRTGITPSDLTGKTWRLMAAPSQLSRANSDVSLWSSLGVSKTHKNSSLANPPTSDLSLKDGAPSTSVPFRSAYCSNSVVASSAPTRSLARLDLKSSPSEEIFGETSQQRNLDNGQKTFSSLSTRCERKLSDAMYQSDTDEPNVKTNPTAWSPIQSVGGALGTEAMQGEDLNIYSGDDTLCGFYNTDAEGVWGANDSNMLWTCVAAGAVYIDPISLPNWFVENSQVSLQPELSKPWRVKILQELKLRSEKTSIGFENFEKAIEKTSWVKSGRAKAVLKGSMPELCSLELEWIGSESGSLSILSLDQTQTKLQLSVSEITCVASCSEPGTPCIAIHTSRLRPSKGPLKLQFSAETDMEDWMAHLTIVTCQVNGARGKPSASSFWATTTRGDVFAFDPAILEAHQSRGETYVQEMLVAGKSTPYDAHLHNSFPPGSKITLLASAHHNTERFAVNLILVNDIPFTYFEHRVKPQNITHIEIEGTILLHKLIYESKMIIVSPSDMFWRQMGGHLRRVETCASGVTWGIGYDCTPWFYTGGWGGSFLRGLETSNSGINPMSDTHAYYVYENQRWNPLTGYTTHMLPTDRHIWSDASGRHKRSKEGTRLPSMHWQWVTDWAVDYQTPGGVDQEGWQYAIDFPASYHGRKGFTDYVRRRRWVRKAHLLTSGPWEELASTKLLHVSLQEDETEGSKENIHAWAVTVEGEAVYRRGVTKACPAGTYWEHVPSDQPLICISCGSGRKVWAIGRNGSACWRLGITSLNPVGEVWETVEAPIGSSLKLVSVGRYGIWVLDNCGQLSVRREVTSVFPEGTHWQTIPPLDLDQNGNYALIDARVVTVSEVEGTAILSPTNAPPPLTGWRHVSAGPGEEVWAISSSGVVCRRHGVTKENPAGTTWSHGVLVSHRSGVAGSASLPVDGAWKTAVVDA
ncbi:Tectonin beta-propeller repeat-containing protein [Frankliniella fusca]|uniref:Tectonin beta-propeller repeat-containing protein n=1 Tax=Frankliniella fusca TaxID=407009 RepID=A0AAE1LDH5_9NEOP|nr:Tectonin beta-propeller repeat-containing protein [Frankliniella fusca]